MEEGLGREQRSQLHMPPHPLFSSYKWNLPLFSIPIPSLTILLFWWMTHALILFPFRFLSASLPRSMGEVYISNSDKRREQMRREDIFMGAFKILSMSPLLKLIRGFESAKLLEMFLNMIKHFTKSSGK